MKTKLIELANKIAARDFMDFTDYDPDQPLTNLADALTVIIQSAQDNTDDEIDSAELCDFLTEKLKGRQFFKINGYWKDSKELFYNYIISEAPEDVDEDFANLMNDDEIFFYGMTEEEIKEAIDQGEETANEFVTTDYSTL